ncbi:hypothetical protein CAEBREN_18347 [Caenorhabditis brenneri]|uniref:Uncharacterized protein n=1 Tax=Caenorhabditis brenneri TaxID=135651 RepID=G0NGY7_CAEBE|nr:hypothetical protein CAEBREN_18347 [Caenorhabditis brenneri]
MKEVWILFLFLITISFAASPFAKSVGIGSGEVYQTSFLFWWTLFTLIIGVCLGFASCILVMPFPVWRPFGCQNCARLQEELDSMVGRMGLIRPLFSQLYQKLRDITFWTGSKKKALADCRGMKRQINELLGDQEEELPDTNRMGPAIAGLLTAATGTAILLVMQLHKIPVDVDWWKFFGSSITSIGALSSSASSEFADTTYAYFQFKFQLRAQ